MPNDPLVFDFHFSVLARSDGHILLAENDVVARDDPVYEIVIGAGSNTFSDLRRLQKSSGKVTARIKGLLSAIEVRSFWIHVWSGKIGIYIQIVGRFVEYTRVILSFDAVRESIGVSLKLQIPQSSQ